MTLAGYAPGTRRRLLTHFRATGPIGTINLCARRWFREPIGDPIRAELGWRATAVDLPGGHVDHLQDDQRQSFGPPNVITVASAGSCWRCQPIVGEAAIDRLLKLLEVTVRAARSGTNSSCLHR
jgi:hypothetical protein